MPVIAWLLGVPLSVVLLLMLLGVFCAFRSSAFPTMALRWQRHFFA